MIVANVAGISKRWFAFSEHQNLVGKTGLVACAIFVLLVAVACAMGTDIVRPASDELVLGTTPKSVAVERYGKPDSTGETEVNGHVVELIGYTFVDPSGRSHIPGVNAGRSLTLYFSKETLVGYLFTSSFEDDHTDFDASRIGDIQEGQSTKLQVTGLIGHPNGEMIYPVAEEPGSTRYVYRYFHVDVKMGFLKAKGKVYQKQLSVDFGPDDRVSNVDYASEETKM